MISELTWVLYLILPPAVLGWFLRRLGFVDVVGFVIGGIISYFLLSLLNVDIESAYAYTRLLQLVGLVLFFFEVGASLDVRGIVKSSYIVASSELVLLLVAWVTTGVLSHVLGLGIYERLAVFLLVINSSTMSVVALRKLNLNGDVYNRAVLQTSLEDLLQFVLFGMLAMASPAREPATIALSLIKTAGSALLLFIIARQVSIVLSRSPLASSKVDLFFTLLITSIAFSSMAPLLGLPELFGAFIAGLAASLYFKLDEIRDLLSGIRDLGLLLYFAGIGLVVAPWLTRASLNLILSTTALSLAALMVRLIGCSIGLSVSGMSVYYSTVTSIVLSSVSETGIAFTYIMFESGIIEEEFITIVVFTVLTTMVLSSLLTPRATRIASTVESILPSRLVTWLHTISRVYYRRVETLVRVLALLTWFSAIALAITTLASLALEVAIWLGAPTTAISILVGVAVITLLVLHTIFVRRVSEIVLEPMERISSRYLHILEATTNVLTGVFTVILQVYMVGNFTARIAFAHPLIEVLSVYAASAIATYITVMRILKWLRRL